MILFQLNVLTWNKDFIFQFYAILNLRSAMPTIADRSI